MTNLSANLIGGATISFGYLIDYCKKADEDFTIINTKKYFSAFSNILNPLYVLVKVLANCWSADVLFLNSSRGGTKYLAPIIYFIAWLFNKKFVFRPFGGNIKEYTAEYGELQKWIFKNTVLKADIFFLQTKALMAHYSDQGVNIIQLPTSREAAPAHLINKDRPYRKRFIYLGLVNSEKGIDQLLEAAKQLGAAYTVHIYGPLKEEKYQRKFEKDKINYQGVLQKEQVLPTLSEYDVLVLPTFYEGEGYPGVIIEAYSLGMPVITTHWKAIPEIVIDGKTGILVESKSAAALVRAMQYFNQGNYPDYSEQAGVYFNERFNASSVYAAALGEIKSLFHTHQSTIKT